LIGNEQDTALNLDKPHASQLLQQTVRVHVYDAEGIGDILLRQGNVTSPVLHQAHTARTHVKLVQQVADCLKGVIGIEQSGPQDRLVH
jgi:hypothetical protein